MVNLIIPCKRPKVVVGEESLLNWYTKCHVTGCDWLYGMTSSKTDAEENARRHRAAHRNAVPTLVPTYVVDEDTPTGTPWPARRKADECKACGWTTPAGFTTVDDRKRQAENHLAADHGVVKA